MLARCYAQLRLPGGFGLALETGPPQGKTLKRPGFRLGLMLLACLFGLFGVPGTGLADDDPVWQIEAKTVVFFNSRTSYEFGNPFPPYQSPLSRLEFPMNSVWAGFEARRRLGRVSVGLGYLSSLSDQEGGEMNDSDWDDETNPGRRSIFSSSHCRMRPSFLLSADIDMQTADLLRLPDGLDLRPVVGFRWQQLAFTAHDGSQFEYAPSGEITNTTPLPGDSIDFRQDWYQFVFGLRLGYTWTRLPLLDHLRIRSQGDWSAVLGRNEDLHLLRAGRRITRDITQGYGWHGMLGLDLGLTRNLDLGVEADYRHIETTGRHYLINEPLNTHFDFAHGVRAWSDQTSLSFKLQYSF